MPEFVIEADDLTKRFPEGTVGVNRLDLRVRRGAVYGLIGRNGAGKTTAIRLLMGLLRPDSGKAEVLGNDLWKAPRTVRARIAYVSQSQQLHNWMTLRELSRYVSHFYEKWDLAFARDLARRWGLSWDRPVGHASGGEQRKVAILLALASRPEVLILDEPVAGLDPIARLALVNELVELVCRGNGCTILYSTHLIGDLERIAEYIGIMDRGRIVTSSRLEDLQSTTKRVQVVFQTDEPPAGFAIPGAVWSRVSGPVVTAVARLVHEAQLDEIRYLPGVRVNVFPLALEEIFVELLRENGLEEPALSPEVGRNDS
jgi:ABC-2 type transport system ATP-binding protein